MLAKKEEFISLKEASKISGYSPDYIGQLIRAGKLEGKQIFSHVAWVTTEENVRAYMEKKQSPKERAAEATTKSLRERLTKHLTGSLQLPHILNWMLYAAIAFSLAFLLFLFYLVSVTVEHRLDQRAIEGIQNKTQPL